eukprot:sb/3475334/
MYSQCETRLFLQVMETTDDRLKSYLEQCMEQLKGWLDNLTVQKLVLVMQDLETRENIERWSFDINCDKSIRNSPDFTKPAELKSIQKGIQDVIRQIVSSVTFLPVLESSSTIQVTRRGITLPCSRKN